MEALPAWAVDDPTLEGAVRLLRRVPNLLVHDGVIESTCFDERTLGTGLSVTAWRSPSDLEDIRRFHEHFGVVCVEAARFRALGAIVAAAPLIGNLNHYEVFPRLSSSPRKKLKAAARWVHYPDWVLPEHRQPIEQF